MLKIIQFFASIKRSSFWLKKLKNKYKEHKRTEGEFELSVFIRNFLDREHLSQLTIYFYASYISD